MNDKVRLTIQAKSTEFSVVLFIMLYKVDQTFKSFGAV